MAASKDIFISYRRDTGAELAEIIKKDLGSRGYSVFKDTHDLKAGHWQEDLKHQITGCKDFILLVTPGALDRCKTDPKDIVLFEIKLALAKKKNIILVVKRAKGISLEDFFKDLPREIAGLPKHNWIEYTNADADAKLKKIRSFLDSSPSVWELVSNRYGKQVLAGTIFGGLLLCGLLGWALFGRTGRIENKVEGVAKDAKATLETTGKIHEQNQQIAIEAGEIRKNNQELIEKTTEVEKNTKDSRKIAEATISKVEKLDGNIGEMKLAIRNSIGNKNLGPEYENTAFHRQYQDKFLDKDDITNLISLVTEYQKLVEENPKNAMYRYLLGRLYSKNGKKDLALREIKIGYEADKTYLWNTRYLLYIDTAQPIRIDERINLEKSYFKITAEEDKLFSSGDLVKALRAFNQVRERFKEDPVRSEDLNDRNRTCWHLFKPLSDMTYDSGNAFKSLVGKNAVSARGLVNLEVLEVRSGSETLNLIGKFPFEIFLPSKAGSKNDSNVLVDAQIKKFNSANSEDVMRMALKFPPIAVRLSLKSINNKVVLESIKNRDFKMGGFFKEVPLDFHVLYGGNPKVNLDKISAVSKYKTDINEPFNYSDFWVYFYSDPLPWRSDCDSEFQFVFSAKINNFDTNLYDEVVIKNSQIKNNQEPIVDSLKILDLYKKIMQMDISERTGHRIEIPFEAQVIDNAATSSTITCNILGLSDYKIRVLYGPRASIQLRDLNINSKFKVEWPTVGVQDKFRTLADSNWFRFTGVVVKNEGGVLYVIPDKFIPVK